MITFKENEEDALFETFVLSYDAENPSVSNFWYQFMTRKVRKITTNCCNACAVMPKSTNQLFENVAVPLKQTR